ncbi:hypothetical protein BAL199_07718 [alpha proteobacterium BAL199]|nr:hypothetical protein BAL199_07718 [alpha proteobacterium BAL199]
MDCLAGVLNAGVAQDPRDPEVDIHLHVADMGGEPALGPGGVQLGTGTDRPVRIPTMPATYSDLKAATYSDPMPAGVPI